jgi:DNA-binding beta-propeller fold protein YncE
MDYIAYDRANRRVWVPAGNTGSVYVIDVADDRIRRIEGFPTAEVERRGRKRTVGPSAVALGGGVAYIGNRGDSSVCAVDAASLERGACVKLDTMPDGLAYVAATREVWVTTPRANSLVILDASGGLASIARKTNVALPGQPEGYAVDDGRGLFYTNLEDKDQTLVLDLRSHAVSQTWLPGCGSDGPKGLAIDTAARVLFVACSDKVLALDAAHEGKKLSSLDVGDGLDNIDYLPPRHALYAAAARAGTLTVATVDAAGALTAATVVATAPGARNAVATVEGAAYATDSPEGKVLVVPPGATGRRDGGPAR